MLGTEKKKASWNWNNISSRSLSDRRTCWVCFATEDDDRTAAWVRPCRCRGTTKWVHRACLHRWIDEKQRGDVSAKVSCPQCGTQYIITFPKMGPILYSLDLADRVIFKLCPFVAGGIFIGSVYWTAVTYGAVSVMQILGHKEGLTVMERADPLFLLIGLPTIPVSLVLGKMVRWEDYVLNFVRRQSAKLSLLHQLFPLPAGQTVARAPELPPLTDPLSATRVLCGALILPTIATFAGKLMFPHVQNNLHRSILGGIAFTLVKGLLKIYHKQQCFSRTLSRDVQDYPEDDDTDLTPSDLSGSDVETVSSFDTDDEDFDGINLGDDDGDDIDVDELEDATGLDDMAERG